ncbi:mannose-1-phosphate guanylyltransferase [Phenylobacterium sp. J367]|uniref:mannose-1-phosphate guanylyltransferase n=1 Tax=Phenylobacterium sp. J367 TaxID=2898435 RepID=UPI002150FCF4|nr:mannose-1-phosphate guanylyltransferase [Phenylobacterium sp. J367]MCR5879525.1 mannose-1-phosphate guanylyltransferase [Phenylobacterium sp. J367]
MSAKIFPVILSGGSGSRLWPLSRESYPKQLLPLMGARTMLQETALRVADPARFHPVTVVANAEHRFVIAEQLREAGARPPTIVLEPMARNTAPAVATAALIAEGQDPEALILVMPADHVIPDAAAFNAAVDAGLPAAAAGALVLFGIQPDSPATGYGYIQGGEALGGAARTVSAFVEKPDQATAEGYLARGDYYWNSGIFLLPARAVLAEMEAHAPGVLAAARAALAAASRDLDFLRLDFRTPSPPALRSPSTTRSWSARSGRPSSPPPSSGATWAPGARSGSSRIATATRTWRSATRSPRTPAARTCAARVR